MAFQGNPNHPVSRATAEEWHKLAALIMYKLGKRQVSITVQDVQRFVEEPNGIHIVVDTGITRESPMIIRLVDTKEAEHLARKAGGLPD